MRKRLAWWVLHRAENGRWLPRPVLRWMFDYLWAHGTPTTGPPTHPLVVVNPPQATWATGTTNFVVTYPTSPNNPYR